MSTKIELQAASYSTGDLLVQNNLKSEELPGSPSSESYTRLSSEEQADYN
jgi:hypothetical protein